MRQQDQTQRGYSPRATTPLHARRTTAQPHCPIGAQRPFRNSSAAAERRLVTTWGFKDSGRLAQGWKAYQVGADRSEKGVFFAWRLMRLTFKHHTTCSVRS